MAVFERIYQTLLSESIIAPEQVHIPRHLPSRETILLAHEPEYVDSFLSGSLDSHRIRRIGFGDVTNSQVLIDRTLSEISGTILTAELALDHGIAVNCAGGTHHAFPDAGSGYCILNDIAITAELLLANKKVKRVLVLDLDVHQGDGTAVMFQGRNDVFTLSIHAEANFPARKQASHLDIGLADGTSDDEYLSVVADALTSVIQTFKPDLVLYDAGVDIHADDSLGRLSITDEGLHRRELLVFDTCLAAGRF